MCLCVFIASDRPLPLVTWRDDAPAFNVVPLSDHEEPVRRQFSLSHLVYAGAHTGCACGFHSDREDPPAVARARTALVDYLAQAAGAGEVEVFVCWEGDYDQAPVSKIDRPVADLRKTADWLEELAFTRIARSSA